MLLVVQHVTDDDEVLLMDDLVEEHQMEVSVNGDEAKNA
jgi:hypothetical protein